MMTLEIDSERDDEGPFKPNSRAIHPSEDECDDGSRYDHGDDNSDHWIMDELQRQIDEQRDAELEEQFDEYLTNELQEQMENQLHEDLQRELDLQYEQMLVKMTSCYDEDPRTNVPTSAKSFFPEASTVQLNSTHGGSAEATVGTINARIKQIAEQYENCTLDDDE
eukprot:scaffold1807_cov140-Cylindrotheca_fusiformis.AAC.9